MARQLTEEQKAAKRARAQARRHNRASGLEVPASFAKEIKEAKKADRAEGVRIAAARMAAELFDKLGEK